MFNKFVKNNSPSITTLVTLAILSLFVSCAPKPKKSETKLNLVSGMAIADINMDGGAIVYGQQQDGPGSWAKIFRPGDDVVVDMAFGVWNFSVIAYAGPIPLDGTKECAVVNNVNIASENEVIDVVVNGSNCFAAGMRNLKLVRCSDSEFNSGDPVATCSQLTGFESYRLRLLSHRVGTLTGDGLTSKCYQESTFGGAGAPVVPMGITNISTMPFEVIGYTGVSCDTDPVVVSFPVSLSQPKSTSLKSFWSGPSLTLAINNDGPGLDATPPALTIVPTSAVNSAGKNWINAGSVSSFTVTGTCEAGPIVDFELNAVSMGISTTCPAGTFSHTFDFSGYPEDATNALNLAAKQTDTAGNVGVAQTPLYKDTTAPTSGSVTSFTPTPNGANYITVTNPTVAFTKGSDSGSGGKTYELFRYGTTACTGPRTSQTITEPATSFILSLTNGSTNSFKVRAIDHAGNTSADSTCFGSPLLVDTTAPAAATGLALTPTNPTNDTTPNYTWTLSVAPDIASQEVEIYNAGCGSLQETMTGLTSTDTTVNLTARTEGTWSIRVATIDNAGNRTLSTCSPNVIIDTTLPPNPVVTGFVGTSPSNATQVTVNFNESVDLPSGTKEYQVGFYNDGVCTTPVETVTVTDGGSPTFSATTTTLTPTTNDGTYKVKIVTVDNAGNTRTSPCSTANIVRDTIPPAISTSVDWLTVSPTFKKHLESGTFSHDIGGGAVQVDLNLYSMPSCTGSPIYSNLAQPTSLTSFTRDVDNASTYSFSILTRDSAGNQSAPVCSSDLTVNQGSMGLGSRYYDSLKVSGAFLLVSDFGIEVYSGGASLPNFAVQKVIRKVGFSVRGVAFLNNHLIGYTDTTGEMHLWKVAGGADTLTNPKYIGPLNFGVTSVKDWAVKGNHFFVLDNSNTLHGVDLTIPTSPSLNFSPTAVGTGCTSVEYHPSTDYVFVGCGSFIKPVDVSTVASPVFHPAHDPSSSMVFDVMRFNPNDNYIFVGGNGVGGSLGKLDVSTPTTPETIQELTAIGGPVLEISEFDPVSGDTAICVGGSPDGYARINSGPLTIRNALGANSTGNNCTGVHVNDQYTVGFGVNGLTLRIAAGPAPSQIDDTLMKGGYVRAVSGDADPTGTPYAVASLLSGGVQIFDMTNPREPKHAYNLAISSRGVTTTPGNFMVALDGVTLKRWDMGTITAPSFIGSEGINTTIPSPTLVPGNDVDIYFDQGNTGHFYIGGGTGVFAIFANPALTTLAKVQTPCSTKVMSVKTVLSKAVAVCEDGDVHSYDISTVSSPVLNDSLDRSYTGTSQVTHMINGDGNNFYIAREDGGIDMVSVNTADGTITDNGNFNAGAKVFWLHRPATEPFMFAGSNSKIMKIGISGPTTLSVDAQSNTVPGWSTYISPSGDPLSATPPYILTGTGYSGFQVIDVSDTDHMFQ